MAATMAPEPGLHAVLGGSRGIGRAYALWHARRGARLVLFARDESWLRSARGELLSAGAATVEAFPADLLNSASRRAALARLDGRSLSSLFVGGPSPPAGTVDQLTIDGLRTACEACLVYPHEALSWASSASAGPGRIILLSSSAAIEPPAGHRFFASALLRRALDQLVDSLAPSLAKRGITVEVWRPQVVLTPLSEAYARGLPPSGHGDTPRARLAVAFRVADVPTAEQYVERLLGGSQGEAGGWVTTSNLGGS